MKKSLIFGLSLLLSLSLFVLACYFVIGITTSAAGTDIRLVVDDQETACDVAPVKSNGRVLVPLRVLAEMTGCKVEWFESDQRVVVYTPVENEPYLVMYINKEKVTVYWHDGKTGDSGSTVETIDAPPTLVDGRTMVPVRFISEKLGYTVTWSEKNQTVYLYSPWYAWDE